MKAMKWHNTKNSNDQHISAVSWFIVNHPMLRYVTITELFETTYDVQFERMRKIAPPMITEYQLIGSTRLHTMQIIVEMLDMLGNMIHST